MVNPYPDNSDVPGLKGVEATESSPNTLSLFPYQDKKGKKRGRHELLRDLWGPLSYLEMFRPAPSSHCGHITLIREAVTPPSPLRVIAILIFTYLLIRE